MQTATNQLAELTAIHEGLKRIDPGMRVEVRTDSECCVRWFTPKVTPDGQPVYKGGVLQTVYQRSDPFVYALCHHIETVIAQQELQVSFRHVRGHGRDPDLFNRYWNALADKLAGQARLGGQT